MPEASPAPIRRREDVLRDTWLKEREKRQGAPKRVKLGLQRKLFLLIVTLIAGLLVAVYQMTLSDEKLVLRRELKIRGGTVARNLADSIYNSYTDLSSAKRANPFDIFTFDPNAPNENEPLQFSDAMKKAAEQQDFLAGYAVDPANRAFVHSARKGYLFAQATPAGVYDFKAIYPVKQYLERLLEREKTPLSRLEDPEARARLAKPLADFKGTLELFVKDDEKVRVSLADRSNGIHLVVARVDDPKADERRLDLRLKRADLERIASLALEILREDYDETRLFLQNTVRDYRNLRRLSRLDQDRKALEVVFEGLETLLDKEYLANQEIAAGLAQVRKVCELLVDKDIRREAVGSVAALANYLKRFSPIVQLQRQPVAGAETRDDLFITYPMCETKSYFTTYRGEVHLQLSSQGITYTINYAERKLQYAAVLAILVGTFFAIVMAFFITSPVKKLMAAMRKVGAGDLNQTVIVGVSDEIGVLADNFNEMTEGLREKEKIRSAMNKAVSKEIAEVMLSGELKLGGEKKDITVLFSDIRGFTTHSENSTPEEVVEMLNGYLTLMSDIITRHRGVVDKYVGDEIMALWGAPKSYGVETDAVAAVRTALEMMEDLGRYNTQRVAEGLLPIDIGIGLNTGPVIAANMGSEERLNYTVIGDNVNLGARLEGTNKVYGTHIIISEKTLNVVRRYVYARELDLIAVKGKSEPIGIYEVLGLTPEGEAVKTSKD